MAGRRECACPIHGSMGTRTGLEAGPILFGSCRVPGISISVQPQAERGSHPRKTCLFISFTITMEKPPSAINRCLEKPFVSPIV